MLYIDHSHYYLSPIEFSVPTELTQLYTTVSLDWKLKTYLYIFGIWKEAQGTYGNPMKIVILEGSGAHYHHCSVCFYPFLLFLHPCNLFFPLLATLFYFIFSEHTFSPLSLLSVIYCIISFFVTLAVRYFLSKRRDRW